MSEETTRSGEDTGAPVAVSLALAGASLEKADAFLDHQRHHMREQLKEISLRLWELRLGVLLRIATAFVGSAQFGPMVEQEQWTLQMYRFTQIFERIVKRVIVVASNGWMNSLCGSLSLMILFGPAYSQALHVPSLIDLGNLSNVSSPALSPDGKWVAYQIQRPDYRSDSYNQELVIENSETGRRLTIPPLGGMLTGLEWSPDGHWLAFVVHPKQGTSQLWAIPSVGGALLQMTNSKTSVGIFHWSADSRQIAFLTAQPDQALKSRTEKFGSFEVVGKDFRQTQMWSFYLNLIAGRIQPQTPTSLVSSSTFSIEDFAWSPDSTKIAFTAAKSPLLTDYPSQDIYLLNKTKGNEVRKVVGLPSPDFSPIFSPDGTKLAFLTWLGQPNFFLANLHIGVIDVKHAWQHPAMVPSDLKNLTSDFDEDPVLRGWSGNSLYFSAEQKTGVHLFRVDSDGKNIARLTSGADFVLDDVSFSRDFKHVAIVAEDASHMPELYLSGLAPFSLRKLTHSTDQVKNWRLGIPKVITWRSPDGTPIEGVLYSPAALDLKRKHPLIVDLHGGPADVSRATLSPSEAYYPTQQFLNHGAFVLKPNYRGSSGYGASFRSNGLKNIGANEMADVMSGVDYLEAKGNIDPQRLAVLGSSWGGYLTLFLITHTDRFRVASESSGMADLTTDYSLTDNPDILVQFFNGTPWKVGDVYRVNSPVSNAAKSKTPILIQHGRDDKRSPVANALEIHRAFQDAGVESHLIIYNGFGHGYDSAKANMTAKQTNLDWINHFLWDQPIPSVSPIWGSSQ